MKCPKCGNETEKESTLKEYLQEWEKERVLRMALGIDKLMTTPTLTDCMREIENLKGELLGLTQRFEEHKHIDERGSFDMMTSTPDNAHV
jgi:hypothetical protein